MHGRWMGFLEYSVLRFYYQLPLAHFNTGRLILSLLFISFVAVVFRMCRLLQSLIFYESRHCRDILEGGLARGVDCDGKALGLIF